MRKSLLLGLVLVASPAVFGQARTVDNFTLEKFKQQRLAAEKDLRKNYAELGFPSPEEMERQRQQDEEETSELLDKLREERLERERIDLERQRIAVEMAQANASQAPVILDGGSDYGYGYGGVFFSDYRGRRGNRFRRHGKAYYPSYRVTPVGVFPNGNSTPRRLPRHVPLRRRR